VTDAAVAVITLSGGWQALPPELAQCVRDALREDPQTPQTADSGSTGLGTLPPARSAAPTTGEDRHGGPGSVTE